MPPQWNSVAGIKFKVKSAGHHLNGLQGSYQSGNLNPELFVFDFS
jgi:hypothetical protein